MVKKKLNSLLLFLALFFLGATSSLIFPPFDNSWQGYFALIVFLGMMFWKKRPPKQLFWWAYVFGFAFYAVSFSWINNALLIDGNKFICFIPLVFFATGSFFALFWAIPASISSYGKTDFNRILIFSLAFSVMEWVRSFIFTGFPWNLLGTALSFSPRLIQGASVVGTYGIGLLLILFLNGVALSMISALHRQWPRGSVVLILLPSVFFYWQSLSYRVADIPPAEGFTVRLVQPSIPQTFKWNQEAAYHNFRHYIDLTTSMPMEGIKLVVWGETAVPYYLDRDDQHLKEVTEAIPEDGFLATGLLRIGYEYGKYVPYNSLFVIDKSGDIKDYYDKAHLVPFGEYLPFRSYLPSFMTPIANVVGDLGKGEKYKNIQVNGLPLFGGAICYESIFPNEVLNKEHKPDILLVLANDGWYGVSAGPYQHLAAAQMRAVEEGITIIRSANTGISAVVLSNGDILGLIGLNEVGISDVILPNITAYQTIYGVYGNLVVFILWIFLLLWVLLSNSIKGCCIRLKRV